MRTVGRRRCGCVLCDVLTKTNRQRHDMPQTHRPRIEAHETQIQCCSSPRCRHPGVRRGRPHDFGCGRLSRSLAAVGSSKSCPNRMRLWEPRTFELPIPAVGAPAFLMMIALLHRGRRRRDRGKCSSTADLVLISLEPYVAGLQEHNAVTCVDCPRPRGSVRRSNMPFLGGHGGRLRTGRR